MITEININCSYKVVLPERLNWNNERPKFEKGALIWYTDGSKMDGKTGVGVYGPNYALSKALGLTPTIFQAEMHAIELCAYENIKKGIRGANIYILSDSQAALKALSSYTIESKLVRDCHSILNQLAKHNKVTLMWVPGHEGIEGNEIADRLAKKGALAPFIGPEPFCGVPNSYFKEKIREWEHKIKLKLWNSIPKLNHSKEFITISAKRSKELLSLSKQELRQITGLLTGHCPLKDHLFKMGKLNVSTCRFCNEEKETARHILCECEYITHQRRRHLEFAFPTSGEIALLPPRKILNFCKSIKLDWDI